MCGGMDCLAGFTVALAAILLGVPDLGERLRAVPEMGGTDLQLLILGLGGVAGMVLLSILVAITKLWAGWCFQTMHKPWFCYFAAILSLLSFPYGTVIGIATLVVLRRPAIRDAFHKDAWNEQPVASTQNGHNS